MKDKAKFKAQLEPSKEDLADAREQHGQKVEYATKKFKLNKFT